MPIPIPSHCLCQSFTGHVGREFHGRSGDADSGVLCPIVGDFVEGSPAGERPVISMGIGDIKVNFLGLVINPNISDNFPGNEVVAVGGDAAVVVEPFRGEDQGVAVPVDVDGGA